MLAALPIDVLASPSATGESSFLEEIVCAHAAEVVERTLAGVGGRVPSHPGLVQLMAEASAGDLDFETAWDPSFGALHADVVRHRVARAEPLIAVAIRLHERGWRGAWSARSVSDFYVRFERWLLGRCQELLVHADNGVVEIRTRAAQRLGVTSFRHQDGVWIADGDAEELPEVHHGCGRVLIVGRHDLWRDELADIAFNLDPDGGESMASRVGAAFDALRRASPSYFRWVARVVRLTVPWKVQSERRPTGSSSSSLAPGLIAIGNHDDAVSMAESLVHEASHHHFYALLRIGPVHSGSDSTLYHNPFLDRNRPIDRILLAYHAFVNVHLFFSDASRRLSDEERAALEPRRVEVADGLASLTRTLEGATSLTPLGSTMFAHLRQRMLDGASC